MFPEDPLRVKNSENLCKWSVSWIMCIGADLCQNCADGVIGICGGHMMQIPPTGSAAQGSASLHDSVQTPRPLSSNRKRCAAALLMCTTEVPSHHPLLSVSKPVRCVRMSARSLQPSHCCRGGKWKLRAEGLLLVNAQFCTEVSHGAAQTLQGWAGGRGVTDRTCSRLGGWWPETGMVLWKTVFQTACSLL